MSKRKDIEVFSLSFMDLISCALGGVIILMLIFSTLVVPDGANEPATPNDQASVPLSPYYKKGKTNFFVVHVYTQGNGGYSLSSVKTLHLETTNELIQFQIENSADRTSNQSRHVCQVLDEYGISSEYEFRLSNLSSEDSLIQIFTVPNHIDTALVEDFSSPVYQFSIVKGKNGLKIYP